MEDGGGFVIGEGLLIEGFASVTKWVVHVDEDGAIFVIGGIDKAKIGGVVARDVCAYETIEGKVGEVELIGFVEAFVAKCECVGFVVVCDGLWG